MSLNIALTGINASNTELGVISDNIANVNTTGFKKSRTEFGDLVNTLSLDSSGLGVRLQRTTQTFAQGSIEETGRTFDMAITGEGFFQLKGEQGIVYSRAGNFNPLPITETVAGQKTTTSYIVDSLGQRLQGFVMQEYPARATTEVRMNLTLQNLDSLGFLAIALENDPADFDAENPLTYNHITAVEVIDVKGFAHSLKSYWLHIPATPPTFDSHTWQVFHQLDDRPVIDGGTVTFDDGILDPTLLGTISTNNLMGSLTFSTAELGTGSSALTITLKDNSNPAIALNALPAGSDTLREGTEFSIDELTADGVLAARQLSNVASDLFIDAATLPPQITRQVQVNLNLSASQETVHPTTLIDYTVSLDGSTSIIATSFDPDDPATYTLSNAVQVYDSLGINHHLQTYFVHTGGDEWDVYYRLDGDIVKEGQDTGAGDVGLGFNAITGELEPSLSLFTRPVIFTAAELGSGASDLSITPDFSKALQLVGDFFSGSDWSETHSVLATTASADLATINAADASSYHYSTALTIYDSLGIDHVLNLYFRKIADNTWNVYQQISGIQAVTAKVGSLTFDSRGLLLAAKDNAGQSALDHPTALEITSLSFGNGAGRQNIQLDFTEITQFNSGYLTNHLEQDGYTMGQLSSFEADETGMVIASYSNGQTKITGQVALARFTNTQGLKRIGDNNWIATRQSGPAITGKPGDGMLGQLVTGALENANVELTQELVDMINAQRNFQANAQVINTTGTLYQSILNIR